MIGAQTVLADRKVFRLLSDPPVQSGGASHAVFTVELPRSLSTVQFLRIVPLSNAGVEAPFDSCGIVPIAVPDSRRPNAPQLDGSVNPVTGIATLSVSTSAFDVGSLKSDEPGLFNSAIHDKQAPQFRIRRAAGAVPDPIYARDIARGALTLAAGASATAATFSTDVQDNAGGAGLVPFVRYAYWADVRLPPERNLPADVQPIASGVSALDPVSSVSAPRPMSLPSAPRILMHVPSNPPDALAIGDVTAVRHIAGGMVTITLTVAHPPQAHAKAVAKYRLAAWASWQDEPFKQVEVVNGVDLAGGFPELAAAALTFSIDNPSLAPTSKPLKLSLAVVDPVGRMSSLVTIPVP
jgi:hypothetical protein